MTQDNHARRTHVCDLQTEIWRIQLPQIGIVGGDALRIVVDEGGMRHSSLGWGTTRR